MGNELKVDQIVAEFVPKICLIDTKIKIWAKSWLTLVSWNTRKMSLFDPPHLFNYDTCIILVTYLFLGLSHYSPPPHENIAPPPPLWYIYHDGGGGL